jgi:hypothetical protein
MLAGTAPVAEETKEDRMEREKAEREAVKLSAFEKIQVCASVGACGVCLCVEGGGGGGGGGRGGGLPTPALGG